MIENEYRFYMNSKLVIETQKGEKLAVLFIKIPVQYLMCINRYCRSNDEVHHSEMKVRSTPGPGSCW